MSHTIDFTTFSPYVAAKSGTWASSLPSLSFTAPADGIIVAEATSGPTWAYGGGESWLTINYTSSSETLVNLINHGGAVSGGDTTGRQMVARRVFSNAKAGQTYNFSTAVSATLGNQPYVDLVVMWFPGK